MMLLVLSCFLSLVCVLGEKVWFSETFPDDTLTFCVDNYIYLEKSIDGWIQSTFKGDSQGVFKIEAGESPANPIEDLGLRTTEVAKFYGIARKISEPFSNRDKTLVLQFTVKFNKTVTCCGAYIKLLGSDIDPKTFHGETPYKIMFGRNHLIKKKKPCKDDQKTHLYTLIVRPDNSYEVLVDDEKVESGSLKDDWDMLAPKKVVDPNDKNPDDWEDNEYIDDPSDEKPLDWDKPEMIPDMDVKKPDDWDDDMDGEWKQPKPRLIKNPKYKGKWEPSLIDNPDYKYDPELYIQYDIGFVGFDLWQVESESIFDNILITDSPDFAKQEGERLWRKRYDGELAKDQSNTKIVSDKGTGETAERPTEGSEDVKQGDGPPGDHDEL
ncbi:hypothetical protein MN116_001034 [Schistosoma mekongi]|uniref:Calreticulin n=1 Tax=Schistosoma mekongi TaxID=38744 RepID=A0AAE1ZK66_SCHME|nr:hypothetical protein MN116_001034 [Schistosoma mekongi]